METESRKARDVRDVGVDLHRPRLYRFDLMSPLPRNGFLRGLAVLAMLLFVGDVLADSVAEVCEMRCAGESSQSAPDHEKTPCHCICAAHIGAVIATDFAVPFGTEVHPTSYLSGEDAGTPPRLAASIDHPPQLS